MSKSVGRRAREREREYARIIVFAHESVRERERGGEREREEGS